MSRQRLDASGRQGILGGQQREACPTDVDVQATCKSCDPDRSLAVQAVSGIGLSNR